VIPKNSPRRRHATITVGVLLLVAVASIGAALNPLAGSSAGSTNPESEAARTNLNANLAVLRRSASPSDALPARLGRALVTVAQSSVETSLARLATTTAQGTSLYVVPTVDGKACLVDSNLSELWCASTAEVTDGHATASTACSPSIGSNNVEIAGILPDSAEDPSVVLANGKSQPLPVVNNTYLMQFVRTSPLPTKIQWTAGGTLQTTETAVPSDAATMDCQTEASGPASTEKESGTVEYNKG
jgi:hypothetical protein